MTSSGGVSGASPSGEGRSAEWRCIYDRLEALLPRVEALAADGARLEALNKLLHEYGDARDNINQARLHEAELSRHRWEAACKELLPGDSPKLTELLECDLEGSRLCIARFEIENSELQIQLKEVGNRVELNENHAAHEHTVKKLRAELSKLKQAYETLCSSKDTEVSTLLAEKDLAQNQLRAMEKDHAALFKIKEVEAAKAHEAAQKLQQNIEEMQMAAQNKDNEIGRSKAEAANAKKRALILEGKLLEMRSLVKEKNIEIKKLKNWQPEILKRKCVSSVSDDISEEYSEDIDEMDHKEYTETSQEYSKDIDEMDIRDYTYVQIQKDVSCKLALDRFPDQTNLMGQINCSAIPNPEKPSLGNAAAGERAASAEKSKSAEESNLKAAEDKSANTTEAEMGAKLGERKKQQTTEEVNKPAEKSKGVADLSSHLDAPAPLAPKPTIVSVERNKRKVGEPSKPEIFYVRKRDELTDQGGPSTAMDSPALVENSMDIELNVEPQEHMQQDGHVDVSQTPDPVEVSNAVATMVKKQNVDASNVDAERASKRVRNRASPLAVEESNLKAAEDNSANTTELTDQGGPELKKAKKMGRPPKVCSDSYPHRCRPHLITRAVKLMNPKQIKAVKNIPFGGFMGIQLTKPIPKNLLHYMARGVNTQTKMLELKNDRSVKISLADAIEKVTSLENKGEEVPLDEFLGGKHRSKHQRKASSSSMRPEEFIKRFSLNRDVEDTCSNFAALVLSCVIAPNTSVNVDAKFLPYVRNRDRMRKFNWNKFGLMYMMTAIDQLNEGNYSYWCVNGLFLLSIFVDMVVVPDNLKIPSGDLPRHSYIKDEHISWLNKREGTWDRLEVKELSESVYAEEETPASIRNPCSEIDSQISETLRNMPCDELLILVKSNPVLYNALCEKTKVQERGKRKSHPPKVS